MNPRTRGKAAAATVAAALALVLALAGCTAGGGTPNTTPTPDSPIVNLPDGLVRPDTGGTPVSGGEFKYSAYVEPASLDPAQTIAAASTGGVEMAQIYDTLMRYDTGTKTFVPQLAQGITSSADFKTWTLTLRPGVKFSDGTTLDAAAVKWSQERYATLNGPEAGLWKANVTDVTAKDATTVVYTLKQSWSTFPSILTTGPGMIVAQASGAAKGTTSAFKPIGAGPFVLDHWTAKTEIVLKARDDYWGGKPYLASYKSVFLNDQQIGIDGLKSGTVNATFALQSPYASRILKAGYNGVISNVAASAVLLINAAAGQPGNDVRVRQAIAYAINPEQINVRAWDETALAGTSLFPKNSKWSGSTSGLTPDQAKAKQLLDEAKAAGYNGKLSYIDGSDTVSKARAQTVQAQLNAVGFDVTVDYLATTTDRVTRMTSKDNAYQLAAWSISLRDSDPLPRFSSNMSSTGTQTYGTYTSAAMDALINQYQTAPDAATQKAVVDKIQAQLNQDVPFVVQAAFAEMIGWTDQVHGVVPSASNLLLLGKAWVG